MNEDTLLRPKEQKLTAWANAPSVEDLRQNFDDAKPSKEKQAQKISDWLGALHITGRYKRKKKAGRSNIQPKLIRKHAEWRYASLSEPFLSQDDLFTIEPRTWEDKQSAIQNSLILNYQFNTQINRTKFFDEYVRTGVDEGTIVVRLGWEFEEGEREIPEVSYSYIMTDDPEALQAQALLHKKMMLDPDYLFQLEDHVQEAHRLTMEEAPPGMVFMAIPKSRQYVKKIATLKNAPTLEVCDYRHITVDPTCKGDFSKAQFVIHSYETSIAELQKMDPNGERYKNLEAVSINDNTISSDPDHLNDDKDNTFNFKEDVRRKVIAYDYWGYWDIDGSGILKPIVATYIGDTMIRLEESPFPDGKLPFVVIPYLPVKNSVFGEPDGALLEENQRVIGAMTRGMIDILGKSAAGQTAIRKDALDPINRRRFERGMDYEINSQVDARQAIYHHTYPEIPQSAQYLINMNAAEAEGMSGVKAYAEGITAAALGETATGIRGAMDAASKREIGILRRLSAGLVEIARKIIALNSVMLDEEEVVRITNGDFVKIRRDDLFGNFDLRVKVTTAEEDNQKAQELAFMAQTVGDDPGLRRVIMADIARLRKMPDVAKRIEEYVPERNPLDDMEQQLKIQVLQAELQEKQSQAFENQERGKLYMAQQHKAMAEARKAGSQADMEDLKYVHEESGVTHAREMDKMGAQAEANTEMKIVEKNMEKANKRDELRQGYLFNQNNNNE